MILVDAIVMLHVKKTTLKNLNLVLLAVLLISAKIKVVTVFLDCQISLLSPFLKPETEGIAISHGHLCRLSKRREIIIVLMLFLVYLSPIFFPEVKH